MKKPRAKFLGRNGYHGEVERALLNGLIAGHRYTIQNCSIGQSHSTVWVGGNAYNSVLFSISIDTLIKHFGDPYIYTRKPCPISQSH